MKCFIPAICEKVKYKGNPFPYLFLKEASMGDQLLILLQKKNINRCDLLKGMTEIVVNICEVAVNFTTTSNELFLAVIGNQGQTFLYLVLVS